MAHSPKGLAFGGWNPDAYYIFCLFTAANAACKCFILGLGQQSKDYIVGNLYISSEWVQYGISFHSIQHFEVCLSSAGVESL
jgi:hypothetical protein